MFYAYTSLAHEKQHKLAKLRAQFADYQDFFKNDEKSLLTAKLVYFRNKMMEKSVSLKNFLMLSDSIKTLSVNNPDIKKLISLGTILDELAYEKTCDISESDLKFLLDTEPEIRKYLVLFKDQLSAHLQQQLFKYELTQCHAQATGAKKIALKNLLDNLQNTQDSPMFHAGRTGRITTHFIVQYKNQIPDAEAEIEPSGIKLAALGSNQESVKPKIEESRENSTPTLADIEERRQRYQQLGTIAELAIHRFTSNVNSLFDGLYRLFSYSVPYRAREVSQAEAEVVNRLKRYFLPLVGINRKSEPPIQMQNLKPVHSYYLIQAMTTGALGKITENYQEDLKKSDLFKDAYSDHAKRTASIIEAESLTSLKVCLELRNQSQETDKSHVSI